MTFSDLAAMIDLMGQRFRAAGINPPRLVMTQGDIDKLKALAGPIGAHYAPDGNDGAMVVIAGVRIFAARASAATPLTKTPT
jgi:hypothetical protein